MKAVIECTNLGLPTVIIAYLLNLTTDETVQYSYELESHADEFKYTFDEALDIYKLRLIGATDKDIFGKYRRTPKLDTFLALIDKYQYLGYCTPMKPKDFEFHTSIEKASPVTLNLETADVVVITDSLDATISRGNSFEEMIRAHDLIRALLIAHPGYRKTYKTSSLVDKVIDDIAHYGNYDVHKKDDPIGQTSNADEVDISTIIKNYNTGMPEELIAFRSKTTEAVVEYVVYLYKSANYKYQQ